MFLQSLIFLLLGISLVAANTEKTIFLGPEPINIPQQSPSLADLHIDVLTPDSWSIRTHVEAVFPTAESPRGIETWLILDNLTESQRYEARICWLATQPTAFYMDTYGLDHVFETPKLITSLYNYSTSRQHYYSSTTSSSPRRPGVADPKGTWAGAAADNRERQASILFLRVSAAADYFTTNQTLMQHPEPVLVDIILDPFVYNVLPRTLVPTVGYIVFVAGASWVLAARVVMPWLRGMMVGSVEREKEGEKKTQ